MKSKLVGVVLVFGITARLAAGCSGSTNGSGASPGSDGGDQDATTGCGASGAACCDGTTCSDANVGTVADSADDTGDAGSDADAGCSFGTLACNGQQPELCTGSGAFSNVGAPCSGSTPECLDGACVSCSPGSLVCNGQQPQACSDGGAWENYGSACAEPTPDCSLGVCACPQSVCGVDGGAAGACVDEQTDPQNCGDCGVVCVFPASTCQSGHCVDDSLYGACARQGSFGYPCTVPNAIDTTDCTDPNFPYCFGGGQGYWCTTYCGTVDAGDDGGTVTGGFAACVVEVPDGGFPDAAGAGCTPSACNNKGYCK